MIFLLSPIEAARDNAKVEMDLSTKLGKAAKPIMEKLSKIANGVADDTEKHEITKSLPLWNEALSLMDSLEAALPEQFQKDYVGSVVDPWMEHFQKYIASGHATPAEILAYYNGKNSGMIGVEKSLKGLDGK